MRGRFALDSKHSCVPNRACSMAGHRLMWVHRILREEKTERIARHPPGCCGGGSLSTTTLTFSDIVVERPR